MDSSKKRSHEKYRHSKSATRGHKYRYSPSHVVRRSYRTKDSSNGPEMYPVRNHKIILVEEVLQGEL